MPDTDFSEHRIREEDPGAHPYTIASSRSRREDPPLCVELKRPGQFQHALDQVYVYTVTLALMLRGNGGIDWYRVFGFTAPLPKQLELEAVVAVTPDQRSKLNARPNG